MLKRSLAAEPCRRCPALSGRCLTGARLRLFVVLMTGALVFAAQTAQAQTRLLRTPTISSSQIAFAYANNIWTVSRLARFLD